MMSTKNIAKPQFIFSQYSRKGYSIFSSLGVIVKIGTLSVALCNCGFLKCNKFIESIIFQLKALVGLAEELDPNEIDLCNEEIILISSIQRESPVCGSKILTKLIHVPVIYLMEMTGFFTLKNDDDR